MKVSGGSALRFTQSARKTNMAMIDDWHIEVKCLLPFRTYVCMYIHTYTRHNKALDTYKISPADMETLL